MDAQRVAELDAAISRAIDAMAAAMRTAVETAYEIGRQRGELDPRARTQTPCERCGMSYDECTRRVENGRGACCSRCYSIDTHNAPMGAPDGE